MGLTYISKQSSLLKPLCSDLCVIVAEKYNSVKYIPYSGLIPRGEKVRKFGKSVSERIFVVINFRCQRYCKPHPIT